MMQKEKRRRPITKVRRAVGRETLIHTPKTRYNRSRNKRRAEEIIEDCLINLEDCLKED